VPAVGLDLDQASYRAVMADLRTFDRKMSAALRVRSMAIGRRIAARINAEYATDTTPQGHRFAEAATAKSDRIVTVRVGGPKVGGAFKNRRGRQQGYAVLGGVEFGSRAPQFHAAPAPDGRVARPTFRAEGPRAYADWRAEVRRVLAAANAGRLIGGR
jgi:hypothetical protein